MLTAGEKLLREGKAEGKAEAVLAVLDARSVPLTPEERRRVLECRDGETVDRWLRRAANARSAAEVFE